MQNKILLTKKISILLLAFFLMGFTEPDYKIKRDPFEPINRKIYSLNKAIDAMYIKPISFTYGKVLPKPIKLSVGNFFNNVKEVPNAINHILQGKFKCATNNFMRLLVNSTFGLGGVFDVATHMGFARMPVDFGQTLMRLGYKESRYLVLPLFGPSTVRDGIGLVGNTYISVPYYLKPKWRNRYLISQAIHNRAAFQEVTDVIDVAGVDEYVFVRNSYLQRRQYLSNNDGSPVDDALLEGPPE